MIDFDGRIAAWWAGFMAGAQIRGRTLKPRNRRPDLVARNERRRAASGAHYQPKDEEKGPGWQDRALQKLDEAVG